MHDLTRAAAEDAPGLLALREAASSWMVSRGVRQWEPGEVALAEIEQQARAGQWWVLRDGVALRGALRLTEHDADVWGDDPAPALYVHGLVIARHEGGRGLGASLLRWAQVRARQHGRSLLRLDCVRTNTRLRAYYRDQGFEEVGHKKFDDPRWHPTVLFEKRVAVGR